MNIVYGCYYRRGWAGIFTLKHCLEENLSCILLEKSSEEFSYDYERVQGIVDPYDYMDLICYAIGAIPSVFSNLNLWKNIYFGSWSPFYYRLNDSNESKRDIAKQ